MNTVIKNKKKLALILGILFLVILAVALILFVPFRGGKSTSKKIYEYLKRSVYTSAEVEDLGNPNKDVGYMLIDCDNTSIFDSSTNITITHKKGKYVQGTGAFGRASTLVDMGSGVFKEPVDISAYSQGSVHISLYVDNPTKMKKEIWFELSSSGRMDDKELSWVIPKSEIKSGWNDFYLSIPLAYRAGEPDLKAINYFRIYEIQAGYGVTIFYDNIYVTKTQGTAFVPAVPDVEPDEYSETTSSKGKMIMSCNTVNILKGIINAEVSVKLGTFKEGTGSFKLNLPAGASSFVLAKPVNISQYKNGYIHLLLYINNKNMLTQNFMLELSSSGTYDVNEANFIIPFTELDNGWNELWLSVNSAILTGVPDYSSINFLRIYGNDLIPDLEVYLDDVYATSDGKTDDYTETAARIGKMLASCNTVNVFKSLMFANVTTKDGEFVEGTGSFKSNSTESTLLEGIFKTPIDISDYKNGYVHYSLYINDPALLGKELVMELTSSGKPDFEEDAYVVQTSVLKSGWNEMYFRINDAIKTGKANLKAINYIRFYCENSKSVKNRVFIVDDIRVSRTKQDAYNETETVNGKMIASCNTINIFNSLEFAEVTTVSHEFVEGTGAFKSTDYKAPIITGILADSIDLSAYSNGYVHLSFYVNNTKLLTEDVALELSSSPTDDVDEYQWNIKSSDLNNGWNEIWLPINKGIITGKPNLNKIIRFRMYSSNRKNGINTIIDNLYASNNNKPIDGNVCECGKPIYKGVLISGNCMCNFKNAFNMKLTSNCMVGDHALQAKKPGAEMSAELKNSVDLSEMQNGYLHIRIYVNNVKNLQNNIVFGITSSGIYDVDEYEWEIYLNEISNGWNEFWLPIKNAAKTGNPNLKAINYFRMYTVQPLNKLELILDDVYCSATK